MEELAKSVQKAQAAVLGVQDDLALLRAQLEEDSDSAPAVAEDGVAGANPYYVELQTSIQQKQEVAAQLLQSSAQVFFEQFVALEEKAARLENVQQKEKELQAAKKSMQRYFDAHAKELAEAQDTHDGIMRLEWERRQHLEEGAAAQRQCQHRKQLAHHVMYVWMKKAMIRSLTREYLSRQSDTRQTYQSIAAAALARQRQIVTQQRVFHTWRSRLHAHRLCRMEAAVAESERRAQFFRQELATMQQALQERLGAALEERRHANVEWVKNKTAPSPAVSKPTAEYEDEVQHLRTALEEVTLEFSERTGTYIRQQEHLEQLFLSKERKLHEAILKLQTDLGDQQHAHETYVAQQRTLVEQINAYWAGQQQEWTAAMQRKEEAMHYTVLGLVGRLRHRHRTLQDEAARLAGEMDTLAPLSERCVQLANQLALSQQLLQKTKEKSRMSEQRASTIHIVAELLTDRVAGAHNTALRARYFSKWMQLSNTRARGMAQAEVGELKSTLQQQRQQLLIQQQESTARHQAEVAHLRDAQEQLRRANVRLKAEVDAANRALTERDTACYNAEVKNGEVAAALVRERMECRGLHDKWWCSRVEGIVLAEAQGRCRLEAQEFQWWSTLQLRESAALKVWTASLQYDAAQLTAVCEGWEAHCHRVESECDRSRRASASQLACALERANLQTQTLVRWTAWRAWVRERRAVRAADTHAADARKALIDRHGNELARLHARHDTALHRLQQEFTREKTQLQSIHQERIAFQRRVHAQEEAQLAENHRRKMSELQASHAEVLEEQEGVVQQLQDQLSHLGSVVVEYCAAATFARWRSWAGERRVQRDARQRRGLLIRMQEWHGATARTEEDAFLTKQRLLADFTVLAAQERHNALRSHTQRLSQEREAQEAHQRKLEMAKTAAEREVAHLCDELQHVRSLYSAEMRDHEELQYAVATERRDRRTALALTSRFHEWQEASQRLCWTQQMVMTRTFEDAVAELLCDAAIDAQALRETYVDCVKEHDATRKSLQRAAAEKKRLEETHATLIQRHEALQESHAAATKEVTLLTDTLTVLIKEHEGIRDELASVRAEKQAGEDAHAALAAEHQTIRDKFNALKEEASAAQAAFSLYMREQEKVRVDAAVQTAAASFSSPSAQPSAANTPHDDSLEVSALNAEDDPQQETRHMHENRRAAIAPDAAAERSSTGTACAVDPPLSALPSELTQRLHELELYAFNNEDSLSTDAEERLGTLLKEPFLLGTTPAVSTTSFAQQPLSSPAVVSAVCDALEVVRQAALRLAAAQTQRYTAHVVSLDTKRAHSEEALTVLRDNMAGLLEEQRSLAGEIQDGVRHHAATKSEVEKDTDTSASALLFSQMLQERLTALTSRYARVLDAFYTDITRRQDTFYSVNGMLIEVDAFSAALLQRFEENALEMSRLQQQLYGGGGNNSHLSSAVVAAPPRTPLLCRASEVISVVSPPPRPPKDGGPPLPDHVVGDGAVGVVPPPCPPTLAEDTTASRSSSTPSAAALATSSSCGTTSATPTTPEKHALRERVHLLERMLIEAKVQVAEASALMDSSRRAASLAAPPSFQAQVWAAQDARDFTDLAVSEEEFLRLYAASESATHAITAALRTFAGRLAETQGEMSQQLQTACVSVEESLRQRYRAEVERYEAAVRASNDSLLEVTRQQAREKQRYEQLLEQQRVEVADLVEKHTRDTQLMRQSYTSEIEELTDHLNLLEGELQRARQATQSAVKDAVDRQTELLTLEHEQRLHAAGKKLTRLTAERVLLEERLTAAAEDSARRLQLERDAVVRLQQRLSEAEAEAVQAESSSVRHSSEGPAFECHVVVAERCAVLVRDTADIYAARCTDDAAWFATCVAELLEQEREKWETEVMHLRERVASLLEKPLPTLPQRSTAASDENGTSPQSSDNDEGCESTTGTGALHPTSPSHTYAIKKSALVDTVEDASSQALTLSPSPQRTMTRLSKSMINTHTPPPSPRRSAFFDHHGHHRSPQRSSSTALQRDNNNMKRNNSSVSVTGACTPRASEVHHHSTSMGASPTRCRSPSLDSLELSQSFLRYAKMLSDQRTRNTERLERASALTAEVDDLLLRGVELTRLADTHE
jgi:hypothetical protein